MLLTLWFLLPLGVIFTTLAEVCEWIRHNRVIGALIFVPVEVIWVVFCLPTTPLEVAAGYAFGLGCGFVVDSLGKLLGAVVSFLLGRYCLKDLVSKSCFESQSPHNYRYSAAAAAADGVDADGSSSCSTGIFNATASTDGRGDNISSIRDSDASSSSSSSDSTDVARLGRDRGDCEEGGSSHTARAGGGDQRSNGVTSVHILMAVDAALSSTEPGASREAFQLLLLMQLAYVPVALKNYGLSLTSVPFIRFLATALLGEAPGTLALVWTGASSADLVSSLHGSGNAGAQGGSGSGSSSNNSGSGGAGTASVYVAMLGAASLVVVSALLGRKVQARLRHLAASQLQLAAAGEARGARGEGEAGGRGRGGRGEAGGRMSVSGNLEPPMQPTNGGPSALPLTQRAFTAAAAPRSFGVGDGRDSRQASFLSLPPPPSSPSSSLSSAAFSSTVFSSSGPMHSLTPSSTTSTTTTANNSSSGSSSSPPPSAYGGGGFGDRDDRDPLVSAASSSSLTHHLSSPPRFKRFKQPTKQQQQQHWK